MKRIYKIAAFLLPLLAACSNPQADLKENIIGQWQYDVQAVLEGAKARDLSEQQLMVVEGVMEVYKDAIFNFRQDSMLVITSGGIEQFGAWKLSTDQKTLFLNISGYDQPNLIKEASGERLILAADPGKQVYYDRIFQKASE
jgi:hypothetical protein